PPDRLRGVGSRRRSKELDPLSSYPLSLHDALPIYEIFVHGPGETGGYRLFLDDKLVIDSWQSTKAIVSQAVVPLNASPHRVVLRSEEHTSELQSRENLVCRLLLEKEKMRIDAQQAK